MTRDQLNERIARAKQAATNAERQKLKEIFGTDDPAQIKQIKDEHERLRKEREESDRAKMTREQQLEADLTRERASRAELEAKLADVEDQRRYDQQDSNVKRIAMRHVNDKKLEDAVEFFAIRVLKHMTAEQAAKVTDRDIEKWFAELVKDHPTFAREAPKPAPVPAAPAPR